MKKAYRLLAILLVLTLALCACGKEPEPTSIRLPDDMLDGMPETTAPQVDDGPVDPIVNPTEAPTEPAGPDIAGYTELLQVTGSGTEQNWILQAMTCVFGQPEDLDLSEFFYNSLAGSWNDISEESRKYLVGQGYKQEMDIQVRPLADMERIIEEVFGIKLSDVESGIPDKWRYIAAEKAYCSNHNDTNVLTNFTVTWVEEYAGNRVDVFYTVNGPYYNTATREYLQNPDMVLALRKTADGGYQVLANLVAPSK